MKAKLAGITLALSLTTQAAITWYADPIDTGWPDWSGHVDAVQNGTQFEFVPTWVGPFNWLTVGSGVGEWVIQLTTSGETVYAPSWPWEVGGLTGFSVTLSKNLDPVFALFGQWITVVDDPPKDPEDSKPDPTPVDLSDPPIDPPIDPPVDPFPGIPEPSGLLVLGITVLGMTLRRHRTILVACIALLLCTPAFAADDDPDPVLSTAQNIVTQIEPGGFKLSIDVTPIVKIGGTNTANVTKILVTKLQLVRKLQGGAQIGDTAIEVVGTRNATTWFMTRTNANGIVAMSLSTNRASYAAAAWNNSPAQ